MGSMGFYKRNPDLALSGMRALPPEEYKAYGIIIDLIYSMDNRVPDDDLHIAGWCGYNLRVWKRVKASLIAKEKIYIEDGFIRNVKADEVIEKAAKSSEKVSEVNRIKGQKSGAARRKNKGLPEPKSNHLELESERDKKEDNNPTLLQDLPEQDEVSIAVEQYNALAREINGVENKKITPARHSAVKARLKDCGGLAAWGLLMARARASPYLRGEINDFRISLTFITQQESFARLMEGFYDDRKSKSRKAGGTTEALDWLHGEAERREGPEDSDGGSGGDEEP